MPASTNGSVQGAQSSAVCWCRPESSERGSNSEMRAAVYRHHLRRGDAGEPATPIDRADAALRPVDTDDDRHRLREQRRGRDRRQGTLDVMDQMMGHAAEMPGVRMATAAPRADHDQVDVPLIRSLQERGPRVALEHDRFITGPRVVCGRAPLSIQPLQSLLAQLVTDPRREFTRRAAATLSRCSSSVPVPAAYSTAQRVAPWPFTEPSVATMIRDITAPRRIRCHAPSSRPDAPRSGGPRRESKVPQLPIEPEHATGGTMGPKALEQAESVDQSAVCCCSWQPTRSRRFSDRGSSLRGG